MYSIIGGTEARNSRPRVVKDHSQGRARLAGGLVVRFSLSMALLGCPISQSFATTATGASASIWYGPTGTKAGSNSWSWTDPTMSDTITWGSGPNDADAKSYTHASTSELKFKFTLTPPATT